MYRCFAGNYIILYEVKKYYFLLKNKSLSTEVTTDKAILKPNAHQKLSITTPLTRYSAKSIIQALMTNENKPKVIIVNGKPKIFKIGFTVMSNRPKIIANITAVPNEAICTPDSTY